MKPIGIYASDCVTVVLASRGWVRVCGVNVSPVPKSHGFNLNYVGGRILYILQIHRFLPTTCLDCYPVAKFTV